MSLKELDARAEQVNRLESMLVNEGAENRQAQEVRQKVGQVGQFGPLMPDPGGAPKHGEISSK